MTESEIFDTSDACFQQLQNFYSENPHQMEHKRPKNTYNVFFSHAKHHAKNCDSGQNFLRMTPYHTYLFTT